MYPLMKNQSKKNNIIFYVYLHYIIYSKQFKSHRMFDRIKRNRPYNNDEKFKNFNINVY